MRTINESHDILLGLIKIPENAYTYTNVLCLYTLHNTIQYINSNNYYRVKKKMFKT